MTVESTPFTGRARELEELEAGLRHAASGTGGLYFVAGEPGIGKTRLVTELASRAKQAGFLPLWGSCRSQPEAASSYAPWSQIIRELGEAKATELAGARSVWDPLLQLVPDLAGRDPQPSDSEEENPRFALFDAVTNLLLQVADHRPLLLLLDDLHQADLASVLLLQFLARQLRAGRILAIGVYRDFELRRSPRASRILATLTSDSRLIPLGGLNEGDVASIIRAAAGIEPSARLVRHVAGKSGGNPFFIEQLVLYLADENRFIDPESMPSGRIAVPEEVRQIIRRRIGPLSERQHSILAAAAIIGTPFPLGLLREALGLGPEELAESLDPLVAAGILVRAPGDPARCSFPHSLVVETICDDLPDSYRLQLHSRVGAALERASGEAEPPWAELARHYFHSPDPEGLAKAVQFAERAGQVALQRLGFEEAAGHFRRALNVLDALESSDQARRCGLLLLLGDAERRAGEPAAAADTFRQAASVADRAGDPRRLASAALGLGRIVGGGVETHGIPGPIDHDLISVLELALSRLPEHEEVIRARLLGRLAAALYWMPESRPRRESIVEEALVLARRGRDANAIGEALEARRYALWGPDDVAERLAEADEVLVLSRETENPERQLRAHQWKIWDLMVLGNVVGADAEIVIHRMLAERVRQRFYLSYVRLFPAMRCLLAGRFLEGEWLANEAHRVGESSGDLRASTLLQCQLAVAAWLRGDRSRLAEMLAEGESQPQRHPAEGCGHIWLRAEVGRLDDARTGLAEIAAGDFRSLRHDLTFLATACMLALACTALRDEAVAAELYGRLRPYADHFAMMGPPAAVTIGPVALYLGELAGASGRVEVAIAHFEHALEKTVATGARPFTALTRYAWARLLAEADRDRPAARSLLEEGLRDADDLGMAVLRKNLRELGRRLAAPRASSGRKRVSPPGVPGGRLGRKGRDWTIAFGDRSVPLGDSKGIRYLASLLSQPGKKIHVVELAAVADGEATSLAVESRRRLDELRSELETAERWNDIARAESIHHQIETTLARIASRYGGESEVASERRRKAVTNRIRGVIEKLEKTHPSLASHLRRSVRTGAFCSYNPPMPVSWEIAE